MTHSYIEERSQVIQALLALELVPLPVVPKQGNSKLFNGKSPSYFENGKPKVISHSNYRDWDCSNKKIPPIDNSWFLDPRVGIGTLGSKNTIFLDLDIKDGMNQAECDAIFNGLLEKYPILQSAWLEQSQSGGYRIGFKVAEPEERRDFHWCLADGKHLGEVRAYGGFSVLAPTIGVSGNSYRNINRPSKLPIIQNLKSIGVFSVKDVQQANLNSFNFDNSKFDADDWGDVETGVSIEAGVSETKKSKFGNRKTQVKTVVTEEAKSTLEPKAEPANSRKLVFLMDCVTQQTRMILEGVTDLKDKSLALTKALKDLFGWVNWLNANNIGFYIQDPTELAYAAGQEFGFDNARIDRIIKSIDVSRLQPAAKYKGGDDACWKKINKLLGNKSKVSEIETLSEEEIELKKQSSQELADKLGLKLNFHPESGELIGDYVPKAITIAKKIGDKLKFNEMTQNFELDGKNIDLNTCQIIIESECGLEIGKDKAVDLLTFVGKALGSYHPVREYLKKLDIPDNTDILDNLASRYLGNDDPLANIYLKKTLIGAVQRVLTPGSKLDTMCILYGGQGIGKSTFWSELVSVLAGKNLFTDSLQDLSNKDELAKLRRFWGLELAEIDFLFSTKAKEQFKRFLSAPDDTYRPPYARANEVVPRTCFFTGTTNKKELLSDESGARRFWIIECLCEKIPIALLKEERDLIWAAAYKAVLDGEECFLSDDEQKLSNEANKAYQDVDPWLGVIQAYLASNQWSSIATAGIYENALQINKERWDKKSSNRIGAVMRSLGWEYKATKQGGITVKMWVRSEKVENTASVEKTAHTPLYAHVHGISQPQPEPQPEPITPQPKPQPEPQPEHQPEPQPTVEDIADMPVEDIAGMVNVMGGFSIQNVDFFAGIFYYLGIPKQNEMENKFPHEFSTLKECNFIKNKSS